MSSRAAPPPIPANRQLLEAVLEVVNGEVPAVVAQRYGIDADQLQAAAAEFQRQGYRSALLGEAARRKIGRNEPCPCGSGRKYKRCCLPTHEKVKAALRGTAVVDPEPPAQNDELPEHVSTGFDLLAGGRYREALEHARDFLARHPQDDRLHDILYSARLGLEQFDAAISVSRQRHQIAEEEKSYYLAHGQHRADATAPPGATSHFYAPETWLEKLWIATKAQEYNQARPQPPDPGIQSLVSQLCQADDQERFPAHQEDGLHQRRQALQPTLSKLKEVGPAAIPYLLPLAVKLSWTAIFIPELLAHYDTPEARRALVEVSLCGYHFISEACLHHLQQLGVEAVPLVRAAFERDPEFDPLKVGLISMLGQVTGDEVDDFLPELLDHQHPRVVEWAAVALGKRGNTTALPRIEAARERLGDRPRLSWALAHLQKMAGGGAQA